MFTNPLEGYFEKYPDKRPEGIGSTALWRGYIATFEIVAGELLLNDIEIQTYEKNESKWKSVLSEFLDNQPNEWFNRKYEAKFKIEWFTGYLTIPTGKMLQYVHMGYASTYENYILLEIKNGNFIKEHRMDYEQYKQFKEDEYKKYKQLKEEEAKKYWESEKGKETQEWMKSKGIKEVKQTW